MATTNIRLEQVQGQPLVAVHRLKESRAELSRVIPAACGAVWNAVKAKGRPRPGRLVAVYWDCQMNLHVGVELDAPFISDGELIASATPAGTVATATHLGPYALLGQTHDAIQRWQSISRQFLAAIPP